MTVSDPFAPRPPSPRQEPGEEAAEPIQENSRNSSSSRRRSNWVVTADPNIYYRPRLQKKPSLAVARFPSPLIGPRRSRPQAIHIVSYPSGYVPKELRPEAPERKRAKGGAGAGGAENKRKSKAKSRDRKNKTRPDQSTPSKDTSLRRRSESFRNRNRGYSCTNNGGGVNSAVSASAFAFASASASASASVSGDAFALRPPVLSKLLSHFSITADSPSSSCSPSTFSSPSSSLSSGNNSHSHKHCQHSRCGHPPPAYDVIRPESAAHSSPLAGSLAGSPAGSPALTSPPTIAATISPAAVGRTPPSTTLPLPSRLPLTTIEPRASSSYSSSSSSSAAMAARVNQPQAPGAYNVSNRNSIISVRSAKSAVTSLVTEVPKPVASGSGVTCSILLAEPNIFLSGFDHDGHGHREGQSGTALLRGKLQLRVSKNIKIKAVQLKLLGRARTEWPEGIPPLKQDVYEEESLRTQVLTFFNAMNDGWESEYGNQCTYRLKPTSPNGSVSLAPRQHHASSLLTPNHRGNLSAKEMKRLSLQNVQSRSFNKTESPIATPTQAKGYKVFHPGTYDYSFELPIDHHQLETTKLQYGSVKWELHATVDRAGAFKPNLHGMREVSIVRVPDQMSLEMTEPISISRQWEDQLHYDIIISGKSFPIGSKIPIAFKLTPLAKVQVHKLKVFVTESIEYWTNDRRVTRKDPGRKILLLEKTAGKPLDPAWASSDLQTVRGGEFTAEQRREAREMAARRRTQEASRRHTTVNPLPEPSENILGDIDLGLESFWGSTEIEANVQIPTCGMMAKNKDLRLHPDCSWKNVNVFHWIKVVMRISRLDPEDPSGTRRRHFEISIDSPFTVLNCRATHANTNLPAYSGEMCQSAMHQSSCGCPDAFTVPTETSPQSPTGSTLHGTNLSNENLPAPPQAAHLAHGTHETHGQMQFAPPQVDAPGPRPIHLLRVPSFNPPAFDDDIAPPPAPELVEDVPPSGIMTPPPNYDVVVGTPSVDGMADYFARLADYGFEGRDEDSGSDESDETPTRILERSGRVNVAHPRTPGGRMPSRSLEISRPPINLNMDNLRRRAAGAV